MEKTFCWSDFADFAFQNILQEAQKKNACYFSNDSLIKPQVTPYWWKSITYSLKLPGLVAQI